MNDISPVVNQLITNLARLKKASKLNPRDFQGKVRDAYVDLMKSSLQLVNQIKTFLLNKTVIALPSEVNEILETYINSPKWRFFSIKINDGLKAGDLEKIKEELFKYQSDIVQGLEQAGIKDSCDEVELKKIKDLFK